MTTITRAEVHNEIYVGGQWRTPSSTDILATIDPATEEVLGRTVAAGPADVEAAVDFARAALDDGPWGQLKLDERIDILGRVAAEIEQRQSELGRLIVQETGAPAATVTGQAGQVFGTIMFIRVFSDLARGFAFREERSGMFGRSIVRRDPVGVVGAIVPWNVPFAMSVLKVVPALLAGCAVILKPSPETPLDSFIFADIFNRAGLPHGALSVLPGGIEVGRALVAHPGVQKITFTGSTAVGRSIGTVGGGQLKRMSLELGGKSAAVVLEDANIDTLIPSLIESGLGDNGQQCFALTRILVPRSRQNKIVDALATHMRKMKIGDPFDEATTIGPLISARQRERVEGYIRLGLESGATLAVGGGRPAELSRGWYVEPTLFTNVDNASRIAQDEIFGPVLSVIPYRDLDDAVRLANDSEYGLAGAVYTSDVELGQQVAARIQTGTVGINGLQFNLLAPFGGVKSSGIGREWGPEQLASFTELKVIGLGR